MQDRLGNKRHAGRAQHRYGWGFMACGIFALFALPATPAQADSHIDVACGAGLTLHRVAVTPQGVKSYDFGGACSLRNTTVPFGKPVAAAVGQPPMSASARWDEASNAYSETLHLLAPQAYTVMIMRNLDLAGSKEYRVGTAPEQAAFKCNADPVINKDAHCTLVGQQNATGWGGPDDGFAWGPAHNRPLLAGVVTAAQAARKVVAAYPPIQCRDLRLSDASGAAKGSYKFNGTCQLYHSPDGSEGLRTTHVLVNANWNGVARQAKEGVVVLAPAAEGGGSWSTTYTCNDDPWRNAHAQCSKTAHLGHASLVYDPITDLIEQHPVAMGMAGSSRRNPLMHTPNAPKSPMHVPNAPKPTIGSGAHSLNPQPEPPSAKLHFGTKPVTAHPDSVSSQQRLHLPVVQKSAGH